MRTAIGCGAYTAVDVTEPVMQAAETVYQASIGFPRFPAWLVHAMPVDATVTSTQDLFWLELLEDSSLTMTDIAQRVGWSRAEFYRRLRPIYRNLGVGTRQAAVARAQELGLLR